MKPLLVMVALIGALSLTVRAQEDARPIVRVGERTLTTADLEYTKTLLPFERFKTTPNRTRLIDALYVRFMIARAQLEQSGMERVTREDAAAYAKRIASNVNRTDLETRGYSLEAFAERSLLAQRYTALAGVAATTKLYSALTERLTGLNATPSQAPNAAESERLITLQQLDLALSPWMVGVRSMLLDSPQRAQALARGLRSEAAFIAAARKQSLVRRDLGGAYSERLNVVGIDQLEPELQIAVMSASKTGLMRVAAPFGRSWLLWVSQLPSSRPIGRTVDGNAFQAQLTFRLLTTTNADPPLFALDGSASAVQWLDPALIPAEFTLAQVGADRLDLAESIVAQLLQSVEVSDPEAITNTSASSSEQLEGFAAQWLEPRVIRQGLPYGGAGGEYGLEAYLAARVKVSDAQLKDFYWQRRADYRYQVSEQRVRCTFQDAAYAARWRDVVIFAPFAIWDGIALNLDCNQELTFGPPPFSPSRATLTPIAGGYITGVLKAQGAHSFLALYGFHPDPLVKPFALVRDEVKRAYGGTVARKQLEGFRASLYRRTGAENRAKRVLQELER